MFRVQFCIHFYRLTKLIKLDFDEAHTNLIFLCLLDQKKLDIYIYIQRERERERARAREREREKKRVRENETERERDSLENEAEIKRGS